MTGMGGQGKTSLVGHWLRVRCGAMERRNAGLFFWSFYANRSVKLFIESLLAFAVDIGGVLRSDDVQPVDRAISVMRAIPMLVVLDGLEVLQERPGSPVYGQLLEEDLRELIEEACQSKIGGLLVLTSRFPFANLRSFIGSSLRCLHLDHLSDDEGAMLLVRCGVGGSDIERRFISRRLDGHPLGLRVFAATLSIQTHNDPTQLYRAVFGEKSLRGNDTLDHRLERLLMFYEKQLPVELSTLLGIVALYRSPVEKEIIFHLARTLPEAKELFKVHSDEMLDQHLRRLRLDHLLICERSFQSQDVYSCHPVLHDHFRAALLRRSDSIARDFALRLTEQPGTQQALTPEELEPVLNAISLLLDSGEFERADRLFRERLQGGRALLSLPSLHEGLICVLAFVATPEREMQCEQMLSRRRLSDYLNAVGLFAALVGEPSRSLAFYARSEAIDRSAGDLRYLSIDLQNKSELLRSNGRLTDALSVAREALSLANQLDGNELEGLSLIHVGSALAALGQVSEAMSTFDRAIRARGSEIFQLTGWSDVQRVDILIRIGKTSSARDIIQSSLRASNSGAEIARCHWILGRVDMAEGNLESAEQHLLKAESTMRRGFMLKDLCSVLLARAQLCRKISAEGEALQLVNEALRIAAPREQRLDHADALILRGWILLDQTKADAGGKVNALQLTVERAHDDAEAGWTLAVECGYAWAEHEALTLLAQTSAALGDCARAISFEEEERALWKRLRILASC